MALTLLRGGLVVMLSAGLLACEQPRRGNDSCEAKGSDRQKPPNPAAADGVWMVEAGRPANSVSVLALLKEPHPKARRRGALAAGRIAAPSLMRAAVRLLGDEDPAVRAAAAWAVGLADFAQAEESLLIRLALDDDLRVRVAALRSLGLVGGAQAAKALLKLVADVRTTAVIRAQVLVTLALLARRGSTTVIPAASLALKILAGPAKGIRLRRAAAYLLATLVQRYDKARKGLSAKQRLTLMKSFDSARDAEIRVQLGRVVIRLGLLTDPQHVDLVFRGGGLGSAALAALRIKPAIAKILKPRLDGLLKRLPGASCKGALPVVLWGLLGKLVAAPHGRGRAWCVCREIGVSGLFDQLSALVKKAEANSCQAHQLAHLACRAAAVADRHDGRAGRLKGCGGGALTLDEEAAFLAWALGNGRVDRRPWKRLRRLYVQGKVRTRVAVLTAAGRLGGERAHALVNRGLASGELAIFGAAAEACRKLIKTAAPVRRSCTISARLRLVALGRPPAFADLWRWIELVQLVPGIGDNAVVAQLRAAAGSHHPHLRYLARSALRQVVGRLPREKAWRADPRRPPAEPLTRAVTLEIETGAGTMTLRLRPDWAPVTAAYFLRLVDRGEFASTTIHRVVPGFVIQGGDRTATGFGGDTSLMLSEWSVARYVRGVVGLAHAGKDTEGSQFFVTLGAAPHLDGRYTAFGEITAGLEVAERLIPGARIRIRRAGTSVHSPAGKGGRK